MEDRPRRGRRLALVAISRSPFVDCSKRLLAHDQRRRLGQRRLGKVARMQAEIQGVLDSFGKYPFRPRGLMMRARLAHRRAIAAVGMVRDGARDQFDGATAILDANGIQKLLERFQGEPGNEIKQLGLGEVTDVGD